MKCRLSIHSVPTVVTGFVLALVLTTTPRAEAQPETERAPIVYRLLSRFAVDLDTVFHKTLGLEPISCDFTSAIDQKVRRHDGIGPCLYRSWRAGTKTTEIPGVIRAIVKPTRGHGEHASLEIRWRAAEGTLWNNLSRVLKMRRDKGLPEEMRETTILGTILVRFEEPIEPAVLLGPRASLLLSYQDRGVERLEISTHHDSETGRESHVRVLFFVADEAEAAYELEVHTDVNILKKRGFFLDVEGQ